MQTTYRAREEDRVTDARTDRPTMLASLPSLSTFAESWNGRDYRGVPRGRPRLVVSRSPRRVRPSSEVGVGPWNVIGISFLLPSSLPFISSSVRPSLFPKSDTTFVARPPCQNRPGKGREEREVGWMYGTSPGMEGEGNRGQTRTADLAANGNAQSLNAKEESGGGDW